MSLAFRSPDYFALMVLGLTAVSAFSAKGQFLKAMMMAVLGLMLATVGQDTLSDIPRFVFNNMNLSDGISFVLVVMATFAMSEALSIIFKGSDPTQAAKQISLSKLGSIKLDKDETKKMVTTIPRSSIIGFIVGESDPTKYGARVVGAHTDSPALMVKPQSEIRENGFLQLGVEVYGGALLNPWFDRDLSIAGRVFCQSVEGELSSHLIDLKRPVAFIPSLAIHLDKEANKNRTVDPQTDLSPIVLQLNKNQELREVLQKECLNEELIIIDHELYLYDSLGATEVGLQNEFFLFQFHLLHL